MRFKYVRARAHTRTSHIFLRSLRNSLWNWPLQLKRNIHTKRPPKIIIFRWSLGFYVNVFFFSLVFHEFGRWMDFRSSSRRCCCCCRFCWVFLCVQCICVSTYFCSWIHHNLNPTYLNCHVSAKARKRQHEKERTFVTIHISVQLYG